jgi:peptidylprolyl isomerase
MPKSSRSPQRRRKAQQRARTASQGIQKVKPPFPYNLITNAKFFYAMGAIVLIGGLFTFLVVQNTADDEPEVDRNPTATPTQGSVTPTVTPDLTTTPAVTGTPDLTATATPAGTGTPAEQTFQYSAPPPLTIDQANSYFATISTDKGDIRIELLDEDAPNAVNSFVFLAREGYFDGVTFHRVIPGFVAQSGDRTGTGSGGPGYTVPDEINDNLHVRGAVAMAKSPGAGEFGSQFYIMYASRPDLDGEYTVFGTVVEGMDVVDALTPRDPSQDPGAPPGDVILTIEIEEVEG